MPIKLVPEASVHSASCVCACDSMTSSDVLTPMTSFIDYDHRRWGHNYTTETDVKLGSNLRLAQFKFHVKLAQFKFNVKLAQFKFHVKLAQSMSTL